MSKNTIFSDTVPFSKLHTTALKAEVDRYLAPLGLQSVLVGSAVKLTDASPSNDLDLQVELAQVAEFFNVDDSKQARLALADYFTQQGLQTKRNGINVFVRMPFAESAHQVDLEVIANVDKVSRYHMHNIPEGSPFKGVSKQIVIGTLAKDMGFMYSAWEGMYIRTRENKKGALYADEWDDIAQLLLGPTATGTDLDSVEAVLAMLPTEQANELLNRCRLDKAWFEHISQKTA